MAKGNSNGKTKRAVVAAPVQEARSIAIFRAGIKSMAGLFEGVEATVLNGMEGTLDSKTVSNTLAGTRQMLKMVEMAFESKGRKKVSVTASLRELLG